MTAWPVRPAILAFATGSIDPTVIPPGLRLGRRVAIALAKADPATGASLPLLPCPYDHVLFGEQTDGLPAVDGPLLTGEQHIVKPGEGDVLVLMLVRRRADLSQQAFRDRWRDGHAPSGCALRQAAIANFMPTQAAFDGAGLVFFRDLDHVAAARSAREIARDATLDEMAFIDHSRSMLAMFRFA